MSKRVLNKNFCVLPWTGFELEPNGDVKNCIISTEVLGNISKTPIQDIIQKNSKIRQQMLNGEYPSNCDGCYLQEKHRKQNFDSVSSRLYYGKNLATKIPSDLLENEDTPLEDSIKLFEEGIQLKEYCEEKLKSAKIKIDKIVKKNKSLSSTEFK